MLAVISSIKAKIARNPSCSIRKLAKDSNISATSMRTLIKADLGMKSRAKERCQMLTAKQRQKKVNCAQSILNWLKSNLR